MIPIASIVEGDGEVLALPVLLRRLALETGTAARAHPLLPIRVRRDRFLNRNEEFRRQLLLAAAKAGETGWVLVVLDADDDCPRVLAESVLARAKDVIPHRPLSVVIANREFEAWFIAAAPSLDGFRGFRLPPGETIDAEGPRDAKGWLRDRMGGAYSVLRDQPAFAARFDLRQAQASSRSFRKLWTAWLRHMGPGSTASDGA